MSNFHGAILVLAWPETRVFNAGAWYDGLMQLLCISNKGYYTVGHSALALLDYSSDEVLYFVFGRYHTPLSTGRVRDKQTDPDVTVTTKAVWGDSCHLQNLDEVLIELSKKRATHGSGKLVASLYEGVDFQKAYKRAKQLQSQEAIPYGPFTLGGTNCSRFVAEILREGMGARVKKILMHIPYVVSPSPLSNVKMANSFKRYFIIQDAALIQKKSLISKLYNPFNSKVEWLKK